MGLHPAVARVRRAVRRSIADLDPGTTVLVACSGGADSLSLLAATVFEARRREVRVVGTTVDHALQDDSDIHAATVADQMHTLGAAGTRVVRVVVEGGGGPEAAARTARYAALRQEAERADASAVLLGHTRDDQAETVLLGLARGSGARSLAGMAAVSGIYRRPLLGLARVDTVAACAAEGIEFWADPHNLDSGFTRVRVRREVLPVLEEQLGPGIAESLARTARLLRDDADALDAMAASAWARARDEHSCPGAEDLRVDVLSSEPPALRRRVLRLAALAAGCPATELFLVHVDAVDALLTDWHGQADVHLPGHVSARRSGGMVRLAPAPVAG